MKDGEVSEKIKKMISGLPDGIKVVVNTDHINERMPEHLKNAGMSIEDRVALLENKLSGALDLLTDMGGVVDSLVEHAKGVDRALIKLGAVPAKD